MSEEKQELIKKEDDEVFSLPYSSLSSAEAKEKAREEAEEEAQDEVNMSMVREQVRRAWCIEAALSVYNLEVTESNLIRISNKIYEYVYGKQNP